MTTSARQQATLSGVAALLMWSTQAALAGLFPEVPPLELTALGFMLGTVVLLLATARTVSTPVPRAAWWTGAVGMAGYHLLYFWAFHLGPPLPVNLVNYTWPLLLVLFGARLSELRAAHVVGGVMGFGGIVVLLGGDGVDWTQAPGLLAAAGAAVTWAAYSTLMSRWPDAPPRLVASWCGVTALVAGAGHALLEETVVPHAWGPLLALGVFPLGLAFLAWDRAVRRGDVRWLGTLSNATPLLSTGLLAATGRVTLDARAAVSVLLVAGGALVARRAARVE